MQAIFDQVKPATHTKFWQDKRQENVERDERHLRKLRKAGWKVLVVWECQTCYLQKLTTKIKRFISS